MRGGYRYKTISVFLKVFILFLLVIIPLYVFSTAVNIWSRDSAKSEIVESNRLKMNFYVNQLETELDSAIRMQSRLVNDQELKNLAMSAGSMSDYEKIKAMTDLSKRLLNLKEVNNCIQEIYVYIPLVQKRISTDAYEKLDENEFGIMTGLLDNYPFSKYDGRIFLNLSPGYTNITINKKTYPTFIISLEISKSRIESVLKRILTQKQGGVMLLGEKNGIDANVVADNTSAIITDLREYILQSGVLSEEVRKVEMDKKMYILAHKKSDLLRSTCFVYFSEEEILGSLIKYRTWLQLASILTIIITVFFAVYIRRLIARPLDKLVKAFGVINKGKLDISVDYKSRDEFGYLYRRFNIMVKRLKDLIEQVYEERIRAQNAELKQLQYQINPHFLYNSLFVIHRMAKMDDTESIMKLAQHLGNYYQFLTKNISDEVPLYKEVNHARDYAEIQHFRFSNRISAEFGDIPEGCGHILIPRLILQPIIENCYNHGLKSKLSGGRILLHMKLKKSMLYIHVEDNGEELSEEMLGKLDKLLVTTDSKIECTGLLNVHRRIRIKYGKDSGIYLSRGDMSGLHVEVRIAMKGGGNIVQAVDH